MWSIEKEIRVLKLCGKSGCCVLTVVYLGKIWNLKPFLYTCEEVRSQAKVLIRCYILSQAVGKVLTSIKWSGFRFLNLLHAILLFIETPFKTWNITILYRVLHRVQLTRAPKILLEKWIYPILINWLGNIFMVRMVNRRGIGPNGWSISQDRHPLVWCDMFLDLNLFFSMQSTK